MVMEWLPDLTAWDPADFGAASGVGTLLVAIVATVIARRQLRQARELREEEAAPFIVVDVVPGRAASHLLDLVIENVGKTMAKDVTITFDPPIESATDMHGFELAEWAPIKTGITTLVPGRRLTALFDNSVDRYKSDLPRQYTVTVHCCDSRGRKQPEQRFTMDLAPLYGAMNASLRDMHQLVGEVEKLRKPLETLAKKAGRVEVFDGPAADEERREAHREWQRTVRAYEARQGLPHSEPDPDVDEAEEPPG
jgi:hypothetical protein